MREIGFNLKVRKKSRKKKKRRCKKQKKEIKSPKKEATKIKEESEKTEKEKNFKILCEFLKQKEAKIQEIKEKRQKKRNRFTEKKKLLQKGFQNNWSEILKTSEKIFESTKRNKKTTEILKKDANESFKEAIEEFHKTKQEIQQREIQEQLSAQKMGIDLDQLRQICDNYDPFLNDHKLKRPRMSEFFDEFNLFKQKIGEMRLQNMKFFSDFLMDLTDYLKFRRGVFHRKLEQENKTEIIEEILFTQNFENVRIIRNYEEEIMKLEFPGFEIVEGGQGHQKVELKSISDFSGKRALVRVWVREMFPESVETKSDLMSELVDIENKLKRIREKFHHFQNLFKRT